MKPAFVRSISKLIRGVAMLLQKPTLINRILDEPDWYKDKVDKNFNLADGLPEISLPDILNNTEVSVNPFAGLEGGSLITDLALLRTLASGKKGGNYFEIGTWRGESAVNVFNEGMNVFTLNLSKKEMEGRKWNANYIDLHGFYSRQYAEIIHLEGDSRTYDFSPYYGKMDLVFVDGDHHHDSVVEDTKNAFKLLKDENACIVWHDYGMNPEHVRWNILHAILQGTPADCRKHLYAVSNSLSAVYLPSWTGLTRKRNYPAKPSGTFAINVRFER